MKQGIICGFSMPHKRQKVRIFSLFMEHRKNAIYTLLQFEHQKYNFHLPQYRESGWSVRGLRIHGSRSADEAVGKEVRHATGPTESDRSDLDKEDEVSSYGYARKQSKL